MVLTLKCNFFKIISWQLLEVLQTLPESRLVVGLIYYTKCGKPLFISRFPQEFFFFFFLREEKVNLEVINGGENIYRTYFGVFYLQGHVVLLRRSCFFTI